MKQKFWHSKHFQQIFRTIYLTTFALLLVALAITYTAFRQVTGNYLNAVMSRFIESAYTTVDHQIRSSLNNTLNVCLSSNATTLLANKTISAADRLRAIRGVDYFLSQDLGIHSVIFYNHANDEVVMFGREVASSNLADFYDREYVRQVISPNTPPSQLFPRNIQNSPYDNSTSTVLTSFYHLGNSNYVIVNLEVDYIFSVLHNDPSVYSKAPTNYLVYHDRNEFIYASIYHSQLENAQPELLQALTEYGWPESFDATINGADYRFHVLDDPAYNLQMVSIIRKSDISASFTYLLPLVIIIIVIGLAALIVNLKISYRLYSPIARIKGTLPAHQPEEEDSRETEDEVAYITTRISDVLSRHDALFSYKQKSLSLSQEMFLKDQLLYDKYADQDFWEKCVQQELPYQDSDMFILIYAQWCDKNTSNQASLEEQPLLCFALGNVLHELFSKTCDIRDLPLEKDGIAFLFCFQGGRSASVSNTELHKIQEIFLQYFGLSVSFFISDPLTLPHQLSTAMQQLQELSVYRFFYPERCVLRPEDIQIDQLLTDICPMINMSDLEQMVRSGDTNTCQQMLAAYWTQLPSYTYEASIASINVFASKFITMIKKIETTCPALPAPNFHKIYTQITGAHTLEQVQVAVTAQLDSVIDAIQSQNPGIIKVDIADVQCYLRQNYQDFSISSKSVAEHFHVSVSYLNRIFRQKTGESISSFIKELRLEHARHLLLTTSTPVEAIAKDVGFENTKYFYSLFKSAFGVSPTTYRATQTNLSQEK